MNFRIIKEAVKERFQQLQDRPLFIVDVTRDELWDTYINSFPEGSNPMFRERTEHDCSCCKHFIRTLGAVVAVSDGRVKTLWDFKCDDPNYQAVADAMHALIASKPIHAPFLHYEKAVGTDFNNAVERDGNITRWEHFHCQLPKHVVCLKANIGPTISDKVSSKDVFLRTMEEVSLEALATVLELIDQGSLYRGEEHKRVVAKLQSLKREYLELNDAQREAFIWEQVHELHPATLRARNSSIGTLLVDLSEGRDLDSAVGAFEAMVAPSNYKRPKALITSAMVERARKAVEELGFQDSLARRHAVVEDITVNNVIFANRNAVRRMVGNDVFDELANEGVVNPRSLSKVEEISIDEFIDKVVPNVERIELLVENRLQGNLMSLIAPLHPEAKNMLKWNNNFSWVYNGEIADSMKMRVKEAGGNIEGVLRFSIQWNDGTTHNQCDYDAHCIEPNGNRIYYGRKTSPRTTGQLDVDIIHPVNRKPAVENITWIDERKMLQGEYKFVVHCFSARAGNEGFSAEFEFDGEIHSYTYNRALSQNQYIDVVTGVWNGKDFKITKSLPSSISSQTIWDVPTMQYRDVSLVMLSPNHWDGNQTGNKHYFFILEGCKQPGDVRGFFNEFLSEKLHEHRKVFEVLGSKVRVEESDQQLSGLGFSSTQRNHVFCRVSGSFTRQLKIIF